MKKVMMAAMLAATMAQPAWAEEETLAMTFGPGALPCSTATAPEYSRYTLAWTEGALTILNLVVSDRDQDQSFTTMAQLIEVYNLAKAKCADTPHEPFAPVLGAAVSEWRQSK